MQIFHPTTTTKPHLPLPYSISNFINFLGQSVSLPPIFPSLSSPFSSSLPSSLPYTNTTKQSLTQHITPLSPARHHKPHNHPKNHTLINKTKISKSPRDLFSASSSLDFPLSSFSSRSRTLSIIASRSEAVVTEFSELDSLSMARFGELGWAVVDIVLNIITVGSSSLA